MPLSRNIELGDEHALTFSCGDLPADEAVGASGHEPNGYFWEGIAAYVEPSITAGLDLDSEAGMFSASGPLASLERLQARLEPLLSGDEDVAAVVARAESDGFEFDD